MDIRQKGPAAERGLVAGRGEVAALIVATPSKEQPMHTFRWRGQSALGRLSLVLNRLTGGQPNQTLCARVAARNADCWFCRLMARLVEPNHCRLELARWQRRGTYSSQRIDR